MLLYDFLTKTNPKTLVYVYDGHSHAPIFRNFLGNWFYADVLAGKEWEVKYWERERNDAVVRVYVTPRRSTNETD